MDDVRAALLLAEAEAMSAADDAATLRHALRLAEEDAAGAARAAAAHTEALQAEVAATAARVAMLERRRAGPVVPRRDVVDAEEAAASAEAALAAVSRRRLALERAVTPFLSDPRLGLAALVEEIERDWNGEFFDFLRRVDGSPIAANRTPRKEASPVRALLW